MTTPFYQIGWSDSHHRDIRLEIEGSTSAPMVKIARYLMNGEITYVKLLFGEAVRLHDALGQMIYNQRTTVKLYKAPSHALWTGPEDNEDDPLGSD